MREKNNVPKSGSMQPFTVAHSDAAKLLKPFSSHTTTFECQIPGGYRVVSSMWVFCRENAIRDNSVYSFLTKQFNKAMTTVPKSGEIYRRHLNKLARWKNFNILCIGFNEADTTHAIAASCRAPFAAEREGRADKSEVKCQYAIGQISQPDETQE